MILLDSSILIDVLRGHEGARRAMRSAVQSEPVAASDLTRVELLAGMRFAERSQVRVLIDRLHLLEVDASVAQRAGELARDHRRSLQGIGIVDHVIAATAEVHHADLWTTNVKHFPMFEGLVAPY